MLWLLKHRVFVKCFKATPFQDGADLFLNIEQIIPLPEAEELMIGISEKEVEEHTSERGQATRHQLRSDFWRMTLEALRSANVELYDNISPSRDHWLSAGSGLMGVHYAMIFTKDEARVSLVFSCASKEQNKALFDSRFDKKELLDSNFGEPLSWRRMDAAKVSIIEFSRPFNGHARERWPEMVACLVEHIQRLEKWFDPQIPSLRTVLRNQFTREVVA